MDIFNKKKVKEQEIILKSKRIKIQELNSKVQRLQTSESSFEKIANRTMDENEVSKMYKKETADEMLSNIGYVKYLDN